MRRLVFYGVRIDRIPIKLPSLHKKKGLFCAFRGLEFEKRKNGRRYPLHFKDYSIPDRHGDKTVSDRFFFSHNFRSCILEGKARITFWSSSIREIGAKIGGDIVSRSAISAGKFLADGFAHFREKLTRMLGDIWPVCEEQRAKNQSDATGSQGAIFLPTIVPDDKW